jgi:hypothetical protein
MGMFVPMVEKVVPIMKKVVKIMETFVQIMGIIQMPGAEKGRSRSHKISNIQHWSATLIYTY